MNEVLRLLSIERGHSRRSKHRNREYRLRLSAPLPEGYSGAWIHIPSLSRVRLLPADRRQENHNQVRVKGISREGLKKNDLFLPLNTNLVCSSRFYGRYTGSRLPSAGELSRQGRSVQYRILPERKAGGGLAVIESLLPLALAPGKGISVSGGEFTPLAVSLWKGSSLTAGPLEAQGWLPVASGESGVARGNFVFLPAWLEWARSRLEPEVRLEGGMESRMLPGLLGIPPYLAPDLLQLFEERGWFSSRRGVLLDSGWDYSSSLSPLARGVLNELQEHGYLIDKIAGSPRNAALNLLTRTGLAREIEEGVFVETGFFRRIYRQVAELRTGAPDVGLSELARETGVKKRYLIPLLQYGDEEQ